MANTLRFKRGLVSGIPTAALGEPLFTTDTFDLYIGNGTGNTRFQKYIASGTTSQLLRGDGSLLTMPIVLTSPSNGQVLKFNGTNWVNDSDAGITGSGAAGQVSYWTGASSISGGNNLTYIGGVLKIAGVSEMLRLSENSGFMSFYNTGETTRLGFIQFRSGNSTRFFLDDAQAITFSNSATERGRFTNLGNLHLGAFVSDNGARLQVSGTGYFSGSVGIGSTSLTDNTLRLSKTMTGGTTYTALYNEGTVQADVTTSGIYFRTQARTAASAVVTNIVHYYAQSLSLGASSTVTNQFGYHAENNLIGATNNYGFFGNIASGTGRWNLYMNGTAANYLAGRLAIGTTSAINNNILQVASQMTSATVVSGVNSYGQIQSDVTSEARYFNSQSSTQAATFTLSNLIHFNANQSTFGAGSTVTNQIGFNVNSNLIGGVNNYAFYANIPSGSGRWNFYAPGTALNYMNGNLLLGSTTDGGQRLQVTGTSLLNGSVTFGSTASIGSGMFWDNTNNRLGIGYATPETELHIRDTANTTLTIHSTDVGSIATPVESKVKFRGYSAYTQAEIAAQSRAANQIGGWLYFRTSDSSGVLQDRLIIDRTGAATFSSSITAGGNLLLTSGTASSVGAINLIRTGTSPVASRLTFGTDGTGYSFAIGKNQGGSVTDYFTILDSGAATFSGTLTVSGGNGYQVINSASTTVTALRPTGGGTSIMSTNSNGIHIAVGTQANGDLILATNNTERLRLYRDGYLIHTSATNPTTSSTDAYLQYSADVVAGNAAPHFRTENGAVIKLYQETTGVGNSIISLGGGNAVLDDTTFDGYTLRQIVKALRNQGILA